MKSTPTGKVDIFEDDRQTPKTYVERQMGLRKPIKKRKNKK